MKSLFLRPSRLKSAKLPRIGAVFSICGLLGWQGAGAAPAMDVTFTVNPGTACTPNLSTTELAYGDINASQLNQDKPTVLPSKPLTLNVACAPFAAKFFFRIIDRHLDRPNVPEDLFPIAGVPIEDRNMGMSLGHTNDYRPIGQLFLKSTAILADNKNKIILASRGGDGTELTDWAKRPSDFLFGDRDGIMRYMVADPGSLTAAAAANFTIQMDAIPVISYSSMEGLSTDARLDGKFTIEITQL